MIFKSAYLNEAIHQDFLIGDSVNELIWEI